MAVEKKNKKQIPVAELLKAKRHTELKAVLLEMLAKLNTPVKETEYKEVDVSGIEQAISDINLTVDLSEIPNSIQALGEILTTKVETLKTTLEALKHPKVWDFDITRNEGGFIKHVKARAED